MPKLREHTKEMAYFQGKGCFGGIVVYECGFYKNIEKSDHFEISSN